MVTNCNVCFRAAAVVQAGGRWVAPVRTWTSACGSLASTVDLATTYDQASCVYVDQITWATIVNGPS